ncbi:MULTISPECIES: hypothetical protein [Flavobacterium]|uniref:Uncharacterized protein n=1 Tax=Flavobacterium hankyongi TaxID=1176532 RepID=A0ABP8ZNF0_9FLAO|nr:hypothetical protein [Flavobacterium sp. N1846]
MNEIDQIINYLRLNRVADEIKQSNIEEGFVSLQILDNFGINTDFVKVPIAEFEDFSGYIRLVTTFHMYEPKEIFLKVTNTSGGHDNINYYIKSQSNPTVLFTNIITGLVENILENELISINVEDYKANQFFYSVAINKIVIKPNLLDEIVITDYSIIYNPDNISYISNGEYEFNYKDHSGCKATLTSKLLQTLSFNPDMAFRQRLIEFEKQLKKGRVSLIPNIYIRSSKYYIEYPYTSKDLRSFSGDELPALTFEFNFIGCFLEFLNKTIFTQNFNFEDPNGKRTQKFKENYLKIVKEHFLRTLEWGESSYRDALTLMYYIPQFVFETFDVDVMWKLLQKAVEYNTINNRYNLDEEDLILDLIEIIAKVEKKPTLMLNKLLENKVGKDEGMFHRLYRKVNGNNFVRFVELIKAIWIKSEYFIPSDKRYPDQSKYGPFLIPYESEKTLGIYFSNATVSFSENNRLVNVDCKTKEDIIVKRLNIKTGTFYETREKKVEHFTYHPFYPIYIKNLEEQETSIKLDAVVPAFVLKANEDKQFWHNVIKTTEYAVDALTLLSGVGNLYKFRYLAQVAARAETLNFVSKIGRAVATARRVVAGTAATVEITSGSLNALFKLTGFEDTDLGKSLQEYLFWLEILSLSGELTVAIHKGIQKSAKEILTNKDELLKNLKEQGVDDVTKSKILNEISQIANSNAKNSLLDDFMELRAKYFNTSATAFNKLIKESLELNHLGKTELFSLYNKHLKQFPNLANGHNQAIFKIKFFENGKLFDQVEEFSLSGDKIKMFDNFGNPPKFPPNTVNVLNDFEEFETFVTGAYDLFGRSRKFDSEIKFIYNFLKNHAYKADEFIIETSNIFKTCGSCSREFVLLKQLLENQGKKLRIIVKADESIKGTSNLMKKYPELKKMK